MKTERLPIRDVREDRCQRVRHSEELLQNTAGTVGDKTHEICERLNGAREEAGDTCRKLNTKRIEGAKAADKNNSRTSVSIDRSRLRDRTAYWCAIDRKELNVRLTTNSQTLGRPTERVRISALQFPPHRSCAAAKGCRD
jgi:hypothetical protein